MSFQCQECHQSFPYKRNLTRHIKTVHGNKPRKDNEARKEGLLAGLYSETFEAQVESVSHAWKDVTDKARKQGILACGSWAACEDAVESTREPGAVSRTFGAQVRSNAPPRRH